jgi:hypothetical protein
MNTVEPWQPIETAPEGELVVVGWHQEGEDEDYSERHEFEWLEEGIWHNHAELVEYAQMCAPAGSEMPKETPPYTHWRSLPPIPKAAA